MIITNSKYVHCISIDPDASSSGKDDWRCTITYKDADVHRHEIVDVTIMEMGKNTILPDPPKVDWSLSINGGDVQFFLNDATCIAGSGVLQCDLP